MTRVKLSTVIILSVFGISIFSMSVISYRCRELISMLDTAQELLKEDRKEDAIAEADEIISYWDSFHKLSNILVRSDKITDIHASIAKIKPYIESDNDEIYAEFESVKEMIRWLYESEMPYPSNIF